MRVLRAVVTVASVGIIYMTTKRYIADSLTDEAMSHYHKTYRSGMDRTLALLRMALTVDPSNYSTLMRLGEVLLRDGKATEAEHIFKQALAASKTDIQSYWSHDILAEIYLLRGSLEEAYVHLKLMEKNPFLSSPAAVTLPPPTTRNASPDLLKARMAVLAILQSHEADAMKYVQQLQAESGDVSSGLASMCTYYGYELWENEKFDMAHKIYSKAAELDPSPLNLLNLAVSSKEYLKDNKQYCELLLKVEELSTKSNKKEDTLQLYRALSLLKKYWLDLNNPKNALQYMQKIQVLVPTDTVNLSDMAVVARSLGRLKESVGYLEKGLVHAPSSPKILMELAITKALLGNKQEAQELAMKSGKAKAIWMYVGDHYVTTKDKKRAAEAYQEGLNLFPADTDFVAKLQSLK